MTDSVDHADSLGVGIVGCGFVGTTVGAGFRDHEAARIVAVVDIDEPTLQEAGSKLGVAPDGRYTDYETMLAAEQGVEEVLIGTPHTLHYDQILAAFDQDLHALCDKPLTTDLARERDLVERDKERAEALMVGYQRHLDPAFLKTRELWADDVREPRWITAEVSQDWQPSEFIEVDADNDEYRPSIGRRGRRTKADAFIETVTTGMEPPATALDGMRVTAVTEAAYESARNGGVFVDVGPEVVSVQ